MDVLVAPLPAETAQVLAPSSHQIDGPPRALDALYQSGLPALHWQRGCCGVWCRQATSGRRVAGNLEPYKSEALFPCVSRCAFSVRLCAVTRLPPWFLWVRWHPIDGKTHQQRHPFDAATCFALGLLTLHNANLSVEFAKAACDSQMSCPRLRITCL